MEETQKYPEVIPTIDPKDTPKTSKTVEEYIRGFCGVDIQPISYGLRDDLEPPAVASDPTHCTNSRNYFTHDEEIMAPVTILIGPTVSISDPEVVGPFTD